MFSIKKLRNDARTVSIVTLIAILSYFLCSCASDNDDPVRLETKTWSVQKLYTEANTALANHSYNRAIKLYTVLESTYPYGVYAQQGLLDLSYAYYQDNKPELALPTLDQFIGTYPTNTNMDYALYLKGYINYKSDNGLFSRYTRQDMSERDPKNMQEAYKAFSELVKTYPNSKFAPESRNKINLLINAMARSEIYRARYYMQINAYLAAISRSQIVITSYSGTGFMEEALAMQVLAYKKLGQSQLSSDTQAVLALNFPQSRYLKSTWKNQDIAWYAFWR
jgi:outer membrane protein assembly factor BamD